MAVQIVEPRQVILPASTWRLELAEELAALGGEHPDKAALKMLQRICGRAGWQRQFLLAEPLHVSTAEALTEIMQAMPVGREAELALPSDSSSTPWALTAPAQTCQAFSDNRRAVKDVR